MYTTMKKKYIAPKLGSLLDAESFLIMSSIKTNGSVTTFDNSPGGSNESADSRRGGIPWDDLMGGDGNK